MGKLTYACALPHPPLLIPDIGKERIAQVASSQQALEKIGERIKAAHDQAPIDTLIVISPHASARPRDIPIYGASSFEGHFGYFGCRHVAMEVKGDPKLAKAIAHQGKALDIPIALLEDPLFLDWGIMVPLYYIHQRGVKCPIVPMSFGFLPLEQLYQFGKVMRETIVASDKNVAIVASGDLSHRLIPGAPAGYNKMGKVFDEKFVAMIKEYDIEGILSLDGTFIEQAGECGLRSFTILLGALANESVSPEVLSYEGPFGVGYMVADFKLERK